MLNSITQSSIHIISSFGYFGIALLMAIESAAVPLPSEVIMPFSGYLVFTGRFTLVGISIAGAIGSLVGSVVLYYIGYYGGRALVERYGKYVLLSTSDLNSSEKFFAKYGSYSNFVGRMLPIIRTYISFPAGIAKMEIKNFMFWSLVGSFIWSYVLGYIGEKFGQHWETLHSYFHNLDLILAALIALGLIYYIYKHIRGK